MDLALDTDGDLAIDAGDAYYLTGVDAIAQHIKIKLRFFLGDWFLNPDEGMPYYDTVLGVKNPSISAVRALFRKAIVSTPGIVELQNLTLDYDTSARTLAVDFTAKCSDGETLTFTDFLVR
jgi:hypothetical protein